MYKLFRLFVLAFLMLFSLSFCRFFLLCLMKLRSHTRKNCFVAAEMTAGESQCYCPALFQLFSANITHRTLTLDSESRENSSSHFPHMSDCKCSESVSRCVFVLGVNPNTLFLHVLYSESSLLIYNSTSSFFFYVLTLTSSEKLSVVICSC